MIEAIREKEGEIEEMEREIDTIVSQQAKAIENEELVELKQRVDSKVTNYKLLLNEKSAQFEEMYSKALVMIQRDQQIIQNQGEVVQLKHEIDINILEMEQKAAIIADLEEDLRTKKAIYKGLKHEIKELEDQCEQLHDILKQKEAELESLEDVSREKDVIIEGLEKTLGEKAPLLHEADRHKRNDLYRATGGD